MKRTRILLITTLLLPNILFSQKLDYVSVNAGYGGNWLFLTEKWGTYDVFRASVLDVVTVNAEMGLNDKFGVGLDFNTAGFFNSFELTSVALSARYFPFPWYNRPYIGIGGVYIDNLKTEKFIFDYKTYKPFLNYGLQIQFPKNIYLITDFKDYFISKEITDYKIHHQFVFTGTLGYRFNLNKEDK